MCNNTDNRSVSSMIQAHSGAVKQFSFSFAFDAPTLWNDLPDEVCACPTIESFQRKLKAYLFNKAYPRQF